MRYVRNLKSVQQKWNIKKSHRDIEIQVPLMPYSGEKMTYTNPQPELSREKHRKTTRGGTQQNLDKSTDDCCFHKL